MKESVTLAKRIDLFNAKFYCTFSFMVKNETLGELMLTAVLKYYKLARIGIPAQTPVILFLY